MLFVMQRLYFGRPINVYGSSLERDLLREINFRFPSYSLVDPGAEDVQSRMRAFVAEHGPESEMRFFFEQELPFVDQGVFLPFEDGLFSSGAFREAEFLLQRDKPIYEISPYGRITPLTLCPEQKLSVADTRKRIRFPDGSLRPYWTRQVA